MKTHRELRRSEAMKTCRPLFTGAPLLLAAVAASLVSGSPANAQTAISSATTSSVSTSSTTSTTATSALVPVTGIVSGSPESVSFSGQVQVNASVVTDPDFGSAPTVVVSFDLSTITGVGSSTKKKYVVTNQEILTRKLTAADSVQMTFPFNVSGGGIESSSVGLASFNLSFDVNTMKLTGASGSIASP